MFSAIAINAKHAGKIRRNRGNARKAYDAILHFMDRVSFSEAESKELRDKLGQLKRELKQLGEAV